MHKPFLMSEYIACSCSMVETQKSHCTGKLQNCLKSCIPDWIKRVTVVTFLWNEVVWDFCFKKNLKTMFHFDFFRIDCSPVSMPPAWWAMGKARMWELWPRGASSFLAWWQLVMWVNWPVSSRRFNNINRFSWNISIFQEVAVADGEIFCWENFQLTQRLWLWLCFLFSMATSLVNLL